MAAGNLTGNPVAGPPGTGGGGIDSFDWVQTPLLFFAGPSKVNVNNPNPLVDEPVTAGTPWIFPATVTSLLRVAGLGVIPNVIG